MSTPVTMDIKVNIGPVTVRHKTDPESHLHHIDEAEFLQKVMELMKYIGPEDEPPEDPRPVHTPYVPPLTTSPFQPQPYTPVWNINSAETHAGDVPITSSYVNVHPDEFDPAKNPNVSYTEDEAEWFGEDDDDDGTIAGTMSGAVVGKIPGTSFAEDR